MALYHGVLAPHAHWRPGVAAYRRTERDPAPHGNESTGWAGAGRIAIGAMSLFMTLGWNALGGWGAYCG